MTLTEFLLARFAEDEANANEAEASGDRPWRASPYTPTMVFLGRHDPARVVAECESKRRIVKLADEADFLDGTVWSDRGVSTDPGYGDPYCGERILRALALPYADHPDYRDEWKP